MEVKAEYKQSNHGAIPTDWEERAIGELDPFVTSGSRGWARFYADRGELFIRITNMSRESVYLDLTDSKFVRLPDGGHEGGRTQLQDGDLLISVTADIGIVCYVDHRVPNPAYINQHVALVRFDNTRVSNLFVAYFLSHQPAQQRFRSITDQGAKAGINLATVRGVALILPSLSEQQAIAAALGDVDALIGSLDRLIVKKRDLKQAAMQQLLTGQTRLPGFSGEWKASSVGREFDIQLGKMLDVEKNSGVLKPYLGNRSIQWGRIDTRDLPLMAMSSSDLERFRLYQGDLLVCEGGEVGRAAIWDEPVGECYFQKAIHRLRPRYGFNPQLMIALLMIWSQGGLLYNYVTRTSIAHLPKDKFLTIPLPVPHPAEQSAIAEVLTDIDAEVAALENRRDKTRLLKQGMMQELLTGRTRLV
jgi:type I restriction enzyme, S subunit